MERTLIAVLSCALYPQRRAAVRDTWASLVPEGVSFSFFTGFMDPTPEADVIRLLCPDTYVALPQKTYALVHYALERGFTRLIKVDDDTYLRLPDALKVLAKGDCIGYLRNRPVHNAGVSYPQGGCYSLSRRAMLAVFEDPGLFTTGLEDAAVGRALEARVGLEHTELIRTDYRTGQPRPDNEIVAAHHVDPITMHAIHKPFKGAA